MDGMIFVSSQNRVVSYSPALRFMQSGTLDDSWWISGGISAANCVAAYQPKGAASLAASYTNLANVGTYTAAPGVVPTWDGTNGWKGDGTQWLDTGILPATQNSIVVRFSNFTNAGALVGTSNSTGGRATYIRPNNTATFWFYRSASATTFSPAVSSGVLAFSHNAAYLNGSSLGTIAIADSGTWNRTFYILAANFGSASLIGIGYIQAIAIYNTAITSAQVAAVSTAMNAL